MDAATLSANFNFLLKAPDGKFQMLAEVNKTNATQLNRASLPLAQFELESGIINKLVYRAYGNDSHASGNLLFLYDDLKINFLEPSEEDGDLQKKGLKSFLANIFFIKQQNPKKDKEPREANVTTKRHPRKGFFNMIWRALFAGLKETILVK